MKVGNPFQSLFNNQGEFELESNMSNDVGIVDTKVETCKFLVGDQSRKLGNNVSFRSDGLQLPKDEINRNNIDEPFFNHIDVVTTDHYKSRNYRKQRPIREIPPRFRNRKHVNDTSRMSTKNVTNSYFSHDRAMPDYSINVWNAHYWKNHFVQQWEYLNFIGGIIIISTVRFNKVRS